MKIVYEAKTKKLDIMHQVTLSPTPHFHKEIELIYVYEGAAIAVLDQQCYTLKCGDLFIAFPHQIHYYLNSSIGKYGLIILSPDLIYDLKNTFNSKTPKNSVINNESCNIVRDILDKTTNIDDKYFNTMACGLLNIFFYETLPSLDLIAVKNKNNPAITSILSYCSKNFTEQLDLDTISEELHLSKYYISHLLNKHLNLNFNDYINRLRVREACELLIMTDKKIADISEEVGFGTIRSFNRAFKSVMNITPGNYRKIQENS